MGETGEIKLSISLVKNSKLVRPTRSGRHPSDADIVEYLMTAKSRLLNPWLGDCYLVGYDSKDGPVFSTITSVQALLKRAESNPSFDGMQHGIIVQRKDGTLENRQGTFRLDSETLVGAWAAIYRSDRRIPEFATLRLSSRQKGTDFWQRDPEGMIEKCAIAAAIRRAFPSEAGGLYLDEEMGEYGDRPEPQRVSDLQGLTHAMTAPSMAGPDSLPPPPGTVPGTIVSREQLQEPAERKATQKASEEPQQASKPAEKPKKRRRGRPRKTEESVPPPADALSPAPPQEVAGPPQVDEDAPPFEPPAPEPAPEPEQKKPRRPGNPLKAWAEQNKGKPSAEPPESEYAESLAKVRDALEAAGDDEDALWDAYDQACEQIETDLGGVNNDLLTQIDQIRIVYLGA